MSCKKNSQKNICSVLTTQESLV